jgi:hypothetical protein
VAVTLVARDIVTTQLPVPEQPPPLQPMKAVPKVGRAVRVTVVPLGKLATQPVPQLMPAGVLVMVPTPLPAIVMPSTWVVVGAAKLAVTAVGAARVTTQVPVPVQPPLQPAKTEPAAGVAVSVTVLPAEYEAEHALPQLIPAGLLVTVPVPAPPLVTVSETFGVKVTLRLRLALLPAASRAVTVSVFVPGCRTMPPADQLVVPLAMPLPPALLLHATWLTPTLSAAVPPSASGIELVA